MATTYTFYILVRVPHRAELEHIDTLSGLDSRLAAAWRWGCCSQHLLPWLWRRHKVHCTHGLATCTVLFK